MGNRAWALIAVLTALTVTTGGAAVVKRHTVPLIFEPVGEKGGYRARARGYDLFLDASGAIIRSDGRAPIRLAFLGATPNAALSPLEQQPAVVNRLVGDPATWRTGIPTFTRIAYSNIYPGIDLVYYPAAEAIEFDLILTPGSSHEEIRLCIEGAEARLSPEGDLELGGIVLRRAVIYQQVDDQRVTVEGSYILRGGNEVRFAIAEFDRAKPLIIDPVVARYATYLGGNADDAAFGVAVDGADNVYITGVTASSDFPTSDEAFQSAGRGGRDVFVTKLNAAGQLVYSTYLGGSEAEIGGPFEGDGWNDIAVDAAGNAYLTGSTRSRDFPTTEGAFQGQFGGGPDDVFVAKLSADGKRLIYSTYLGGSGEDQARAIAIDPKGAAYVTGRTMSSNFPVAAAFQQAHGGNVDAFITKLAPDGSTIVYSSFLGGSNIEVGRDIAVDETASAYVAGRTISGNFPATPGAFQSKLGGIGALGQGDAFAAKVRPDGSLAYATFLGGSRGEIGAGIDVDGSGQAYVSGITESTDFPTTVGSVQPVYAGGLADGFVTKLDPEGRRLIYSTFLGGADADEECFSVAVDTGGQAHLTGVTFSRSFPTLNAFQPSLGGLNDAFVAKLDATGSRLLYSSYLGGSDRENGIRIAVDSSGNAYAVGTSRATDFPATASALQPSNKGFGDAFIAYITHVEDPPPPRRRAIRP